MRALCITISSTVLSTGSISTLTLITVLAHLYEIEGAIQSAWELGNIDIKSELYTPKLEHLIVIVVTHHIHATTNVFRVLSLCDKAHLEVVGGSLNAVSAPQSIIINSI